MSRESAHLLRSRLVGRGLKYLPIAALVYVLGPAVHRVLRRVGWVALLVVALLGAALLLASR